MRQAIMSPPAATVATTVGAFRFIADRVLAFRAIVISHRHEPSAGMPDPQFDPAGSLAALVNEPSGDSADEPPQCRKAMLP